MNPVTSHEASHALMWEARLPRIENALANDAELRAETIRMLRSDLLSGDRDISYAAAGALGRMKSNDCFDAFYDGLLYSPKAGWKVEANFHTAAPISDEQRRRLLDLTYEENGLVIYAKHYPYGEPDRQLSWARDLVEKAIFVLGTFHDKDPKVLARLQELYAGGDEKMRACCLSSMGSLGNAQALPLINEALDDPAETIVTAAAHALGYLKDPAGVEPLIAHLKKENRAWPFMAGIEALGAIGDQRGMETVVDALFTAKDSLLDSRNYEDLRQAACGSILKALSAFGEESIVAVTDRFERSDKGTQARVLSRMTRHLISSDEALREFTGALLARLRDPRAADVIELILVENAEVSDRLRRKLAESLARLRGKRKPYFPPISKEAREMKAIANPRYPEEGRRLNHLRVHWRLQGLGDEWKKKTGV